MKGFSLFFNIKVSLRLLLYRLQYMMLNGSRNSLKIYDSYQTVKYIIDKKCSVCRYGDGELDMITALQKGFDNNRKSDFQCYNEILATKLRDILNSGTEVSCNKNILVCIPFVWKNTDALIHKSAMFVERNFVNNSDIIFETLNPDSFYGDSYFSRFYIDFKNRDKQQYIDLFRKIWQGRDVCIIEGEQSRLGVGNDLFDNTKSVVRILCPALNAFEKYDEIFEASRKIDKSKLILIALGQTATVLAYDLACVGYQAIDIGHIDIEYEWFLMKAQYKVPIRHKYVNEIVEGRQFTEETDTEYLSQIVFRVD